MITDWAGAELSFRTETSSGVLTSLLIKSPAVAAKNPVVKADTAHSLEDIFRLQGRQYYVFKIISCKVLIETSFYIHIQFMSIPVATIQNDANNNISRSWL